MTQFFLEISCLEYFMLIEILNILFYFIATLEIWTHALNSHIYLTSWATIEEWILSNFNMYMLGTSTKQYLLLITKNVGRLLWSLFYLLVTIVEVSRPRIEMPPYWVALLFFFFWIFQRLRTCQEYNDHEGLSQQSLVITAPKYHRRYILPGECY